jgi:recombination protein RecA
MPSLALIKTQVESRIPGALTVYVRPEPETIPTGIAALDQQIGGIPQGGLTQICASPETSSGKTTLLLSLLAQVTNREHFCALVDAGDCFDPRSAAAAGVCLSRLLWVRCRTGHRLKPIEQAFKAADILTQNGGFEVIAVDLGNVDERLVSKIPLTTWFRFSRVVEKTPAALVFLTPVAVARSCAALTLHLGCKEPLWSGEGNLSNGQLLSCVEFDLEVGHTHTRKPMQSMRPHFTARPQWA